MTTIRLYNTRTRSKELFTPIDPENVRMYVCGPTVYDRAHLGNARPAIVFDVLARLLRHEYGSDHVTYVRNLTDVDDKINAAAQARKAAGDPRTLEALIRERTEETVRWYHEDMAALGVAPPDHEPRATEYIDEMIAMIRELTERRASDGEPFAYAAEGHVLFRVGAYPEYGALSGRTVDDMIAGARVEVAPYKRNPMDFVLWKPSAPELPGWESPWGLGRPGWHIECSAMADKLLWEDVKDGLSDEGRRHPHTFDIHGGGNDLMFPHHENEIAQSRCAHPEGDFARVWMHNEMLQVEGRKMSKSLGNFFTVRDLLDQDVPGEVIRFVMLSTHYRKPMDWTAEKAVSAKAKLHGFIELIAMYGNLDEAFRLSPEAAIVDALADDLNTHAALEGLSKMNGAADADRLARNLVFLGLYDEVTLRNAVEARATAFADLKEIADRLQSLREEAKKTKDFAKVDALKQRLIDRNVSVQMSNAGVYLRPEMDFDPDTLEALK